MSQVTIREICLLQPTTATTSGAGADMVLIQGWQSAIVMLNVTSVSGTTPALNVFCQNRLRQVTVNDVTGQDISGSTIVYDDLLAFSQMTTTGTRIFRISSQGGPITAPSAAGVEYPISNTALTAQNFRPGTIGGVWRVAFNIGGTTPSFTFSVGVQLIPAFS